jgi:O-antigen/teichoic acid export membrane protein
MIGSTGVIFYTETIVGRALSPELYGDYRVVMTIITLLGQVLLFGADYTIIRQIPKLLLNRKIEHAKFFIISIFKIVVIILIVWEIFSLLVNQTAHNLMFNRLLAQTMHPGYFYLACAGIFAIFTLLVKTIKALGHNILSTLINNSGIWLKLAFVLIFPITLNSAVLSSVIPKLLIMCIAIFVIILFFSKVRASKFDFPPNIFRDALHYTAQQLVAFRVHSILLIIMESLPIDESQIGLFSAAIMIANLPLVIVGVVQNVFLVRIISAMNNGRTNLQKLLFKVHIIAAVSIIVANIVLYLFAPLVLKLYGVHFSYVLKLLPLVLIANIPIAVVSGDILFINYYNSHSSKILTYLTVLKSGLAIVLGVILSWFFNIYGAMLVYIIVEVVFAIAIIRIKQVIISK